MAKNQKASKEDKALEGLSNKLEREWAVKRAKPYPLNSEDWKQYRLETRIDQRFWELIDLLNKGKKCNTSANSNATGNVAPKLWSLWTSDDVARDEKQYHLMTETSMNRAITDIEGFFRDVGCGNEGYTILNLSKKYQDSGVSGNSYGFERMSLMVSPSRDVSKCLYVSDNDKIDASMYTGWFCETDYDDEDYDPWSERRIGFIIFTDKEKQEHAVELEWFSALTEVEEGKKYIFSFYSKADDMMLIRRLTSLESVDLFVDQDKVADIDNDEPQVSQNDIFDRLNSDEREIVHLMLRGRTYTEVVNYKPHMSKEDILAYKKRIYWKLQIHSRTELIELATSLGFIR